MNAKRFENYTPCIVPSTEPPRRRYALSVLLLFVILAPLKTPALTLDEALSLARANLPAYQAQVKRLESTEALSRASLGTYFPRLDITGSSARHDTTSGDYDAHGYDITLSYKLFEGFEGMANRDIAIHNLEIGRQELSQSLLDLEYSVKAVFFTAITLKEIQGARKLQLDDATKDYAAAEGRYRLGVAKLSDLLQASVRLEQAKYNLIQTEGNLRKAVAEMYSLIGMPHDTSYDLEGTLEDTIPAPDEELLFTRVLDRPEIRRAEYALKKSESERTLSRGAFWPSLSADLAYSRTEDSGFDRGDYTDRSARIVATWNLFELGKFYREQSSRADVEAARENLRETQRLLLLDVRKSHEDFITATNNIAVARQQHAQAEQNYQQAFGEYKVGKGDIISLVTAEDVLAGARQQLATSRLDLMIAKSRLERAAGIGRLEELGAAPTTGEPAHDTEGQ